MSCKKHNICMTVYVILQWNVLYLWRGPSEGDLASIGEIVVCILQVTGHAKVCNLEARIMQSVK